MTCELISVIDKFSVEEQFSFWNSIKEHHSGVWERLCPNELKSVVKPKILPPDIIKHILSFLTYDIVQLSFLNYIHKWSSLMTNLDCSRNPKMIWVSSFKKHTNNKRNYIYYKPEKLKKPSKLVPKYYDCPQENIRLNTHYELHSVCRNINNLLPDYHFDMYRLRRLLNNHHGKYKNSFYLAYHCRTLEWKGSVVSIRFNNVSYGGNRQVFMGDQHIAQDKGASLLHKMNDYDCNGKQIIKITTAFQTRKNKNHFNRRFAIWFLSRSGEEKLIGSVKIPKKFYHDFDNNFNLRSMCKTLMEEGEFKIDICGCREMKLKSFLDKDTYEQDRDYYNREAYDYLSQVRLGYRVSARYNHYGGTGRTNLTWRCFEPKMVEHTLYGI